LYFSQRSFGLDGKHVVNIIANNVRICCGRAVFAASASEVSQCPSFQEEEATILNGKFKGCHAFQ
jgi:hypothetical protein